ncbi:MAG: hypothetical protein LBH92_08555 [Bacteroidales bacterium]|jgi:hypothetical protein|nr:hypothetical protein [Bacteroidales bacterium]
MKTLLVLSIAVIMCLLTAGCKEPYPVAGITVNYPNLTNPETLKAIKTDKNNLSIILDTVNLGQLNFSNNYSAIVEFESDPPNYILLVENTMYIDTISEIIFERQSRKDKIKNFQYKFNGQIWADNKLIIN